MKSSKSHKDKTLDGLKWSGINQIIKQVLTISISLLLARLLSPKEFGLLGMVMVITGFMQIFNDFGFGAALIQKNQSDESTLSSVFWFNLYTGVFFCLLLILCKGLIASLFDNIELKDIVFYISFIFIIQSLGYVQLTLFKKNMDFKSIFLTDFFSVLISGAIALWMATNGYGVYSLLAQLLISSSVSIIMLWTLSAWRPSLSYSWPKIKGLLEFSLPLIGSNILGYSLGNLDKILIGRFLGTNSLGIYSRAYSLMVFPVSQISGVISQVMFPSLAQIQEDKDRIKAIYLKMNRVICFITFPMMVMANILAEPFVEIVLGEKWRAMIPVFKILTIVGAFQSIGTLVGNIFMALGEMKIYLKMNLFSSVVFILASLIGLNFGIMGVTYGLLIATFILALPQWYITGKLINLTLSKYLLNLMPCAIISLFIYFTFWLLSSFYIQFSFLYQLIFLPIVGFILIMIFSLVFNRSGLNEWLLILKRKEKL